MKYCLRRKERMKKVLVIGVILLFLGVGFQPVFANEVSIAKKSDVEEDCLECQPVYRVDLLKVNLLMNRLKVFTNIIMHRFDHFPEIQEKRDNILKFINSDDTPFCDALGVLMLFFVALSAILPFPFLPIAAILVQLWMNLCKEESNYPTPELTDQ